VVILYVQSAGITDEYSSDCVAESVSADLSCVCDKLLSHLTLVIVVRVVVVYGTDVLLLIIETVCCATFLVDWKQSELVLPQERCEIELPCLNCRSASKRFSDRFARVRAINGV